MSIVYNVFSVLVAFGGFLLLSEVLTGAPSSLYGYYSFSYDESTSGIVVRSDVEENYRGAVYDVSYTYNVDHRQYSSNKVRFAANYRDVAYDTAKRYPVGKEVTVYFSKQNPKHAVLEKDSPNAWIWVQISAALIMGGGAAFLLSDLQGKKRRRIRDA